MQGRCMFVVEIENILTLGVMAPATIGAMIPANVPTEFDRPIMIAPNLKIKQRISKTVKANFDKVELYQLFHKLISALS